MASNEGYRASNQIYGGHNIGVILDTVVKKISTCFVLRHKLLDETVNDRICGGLQFVADLPLKLICTFVVYNAMVTLLMLLDATSLRRQ